MDKELLPVDNYVLPTYNYSSLADKNALPTGNDLLLTHKELLSGDIIKLFSGIDRLYKDKMLLPVAMNFLLLAIMLLPLQLFIFDPVQSTPE